jgi:hypothetical protein
MENCRIFQWPTEGRTSQRCDREDAAICICELLGFVVNILGESVMDSLSELVQKRYISGLIEWSINERKVKGRSVKRNLSLIFAAMRHHPTYETLDLNWLKILIENIPLERVDEIKKRKAAKYLHYSVVETIPAKIHAERLTAARKGETEVARKVMEELIMKWLVTLPWRQRNIRECRISNPSPNLFKRGHFTV